MIAGLTALAGLAALAVTVWFRLLPEVGAAGDCLPADAVVRFEFARAPDDVPFLYGDCRRAAVAAMDAVNRLDVSAYIPSYNAFAALAAVFLARSVRPTLVWMAILAAVVTLVADYAETITLLNITKAPDDAAGFYAVSATAAWIKFWALALNSLLLSAISWTAQPRRPVAGTLLLLPLIATTVMTLNPARSGLLSMAYVVAWSPVLLLALWRTVGPSPRSADA